MEPQHSVKDEYLDRVKEIPEYVINDDEEDEDVVTSSFLLDDSSVEMSHVSNNALDFFVSQRFDIVKSSYDDVSFVLH